MCQLTSGRTNPCNDNIGGIRNLYLLPFVYYTTEIVTSGATITSFPTTEIYRYHTYDAAFSENIGNDEEGIRYDQSVTFTLWKQRVSETNRLHIATKVELRVIVEFNDGKLRMIGAKNGAEIDNLEILSGGSKSDLNGYRVTVTGSERESAYYLDNLNDFTIQEYLLTESGVELLTEAGEEIILE